MTYIRPPAVAGMFYPESPNELTSMINTFMEQTGTIGALPKAVIVPHAGYIYSGSIAASAYKWVQQGRDQIHRVVLIGPAHRVAFRGLAVSNADFFATPLGNIAIDKSAYQLLADLPYIGSLEQAHQMEHSLEVHLPFLQTILNDFVLIPIVAGDATPSEVSEVIERLWGGEETLIVISSDLSHYQDYVTAKQLDSSTSRAIESLAPEEISYESACGRIPVNGILKVARKKGLQVTTVDLRNSGDTAGSKDRVVGYGAYVFH